MADQSQLDLELQINKAIQARQALMNTQKSLLVDQIAFAQELCRALECKELDGYNERLKETKAGLLEASQATDQTSESSQNLTKSMKKSGKGMSVFKGVAVGAAVAIKNAFGMAFSVIKGVGGFVKNSLVGAFKMVKFAMTGWSKMLGNIAQKGMEAANAGIGLRNAYEDVREQFGGLETKEGKIVIGMFDDIRSNSNDLAGSGLSLSKVFGRGPDGLAAAMTYLSEQISGLGPAMDRFGGALADAQDQVILLGRGLGFAGEDFANMATIAGHAGESVNETMERMGREILTVADNLGVNRQVLADNVKAMMKMPEVYGSNTKEMMKTSVAAQKLGVSIDQLHGPMSVFDDFESAATNAADLAAEFGIMVDATDMMTAEPAEQMMMLKDAAAAAGQSFDSMSRQERRRLAELSGMDADALFKTMDPSNAFDMDSLDAAGNQVDAATAATMAQRDATNELAGAMRRLHESMEPMNTEGGFFGAFSHGLMQGMMRSEEGRAILASVTEAFKIVYNAGKEVGRELMRLFTPGGPLYFLYEYFTDLPNRMNEMMPKVISAFTAFVDELMIGGDTAAGALNRLVQNLVSILFGEGSGVAAALLDGFHKLGDLMLASLINLVPYILEGLITAFQFAIDLMTGNAPSLGMDLGSETLMPMTKKAFDALLSDGVVQDFGSKFMEMMRTFWDQYGEQITEFLSMALSAVFIAALAQSLIPILASGALISLVKGVMGGIGSALGGATAGAGSAVAGAGRTGIAGMAENLNLAIQDLADISPKDLGKAALVLIAIGGTFALGIYGLGVLAVKLEEMGVNDITMAIVAATFYAMSQSMIPISLLLRTIKGLKVSPSQMAMAAAMITAVAVLFAAVMYFVSSAIKDLASVKFNPGLGKLVEAAGDLAMTGLIVSAAIIGMGVVLAVIVALGSNPVTGTILAAGIAAAGIIFYAAMGMVKRTIMSLKDIPEGESRSAVNGAQAAGIVVDTTIKVIDTIFHIMKNIVWNEETFNAILSDMEQIVLSITTRMLPLVVAAAAMVTEDPQLIKDKLSIITSLICAFSPIMNMMSAAMSIEDMDPASLPGLIDKIAGGVMGIIGSIESLVKGIVRSMTGLTPSQIQSAEAAAPLLTAASAMITALMPQVGLFEDQMRTGVHEYIDYEGLNSNEAINVDVLQKTSLDKQLEFIDFFVSMLSQIGTPLTQLIQMLSTVSFGDGVDPEKVKTKMEAVAAIMGAVASAGTAVNTLAESMGKDEGQKRRGLSGSDVVTMKTTFMHIASLFYGDGNILDMLKPAVAAMTTFADGFGEDIGEKMTQASAVLTGVLRFVGTVAGVQDGTIADSVTTLSDLSTSIADLDGLFTENTMTPLEDLFSAFSSLGSWFGSSSDTNLNVLAGEVSAFAAALNQSMIEVGIAATGFRDQAVQPLIDMVEAYAELQQVTDDTLGDININRMLEAFGNALAINDANITVEREQIQVKINLNVIMRTEDVAEALLEGEYVTGTDKGLNLLND